MTLFTRILIADDHEMLRHGLRRLIERRSGWVVCAEASNGREAVDLCKMLRPDVAILDVAMPEVNGLDATRGVVAASPATRVLLLAAHTSTAIVREGIAGGALGFLLKTDAAAELVGAIEELLAERTYLSPQLLDPPAVSTRSSTARAAPAASEPLSPREREVVRLVAVGRTSKEVGAILHISTKTANTHRANVMRKLGLHSVVELVRYAVRNKLVGA